MNARAITQNYAQNIRYSVEPRDVPPSKAARRLHLSYTEFQNALPSLLQRGFPKPDATTGNFDLKRIDEWMDTRNNLTTTNQARNAQDVVSQRLGLKAWVK